VQTRTLHESFKGSYSSLACSRGEVSRVIASRTSRQWETHAVFGFLWATGFLGHNFGSRHARRLIKSSIDAHEYEVSKQSLSQNFGSLDWRPGSVKVGQNLKNTPTLW